jgi:hypothetical protein
MQLHHAAYAASCRHTPMTHAYTDASCSIATRPGHGLNSLTLTTATRAAGPRPNVIRPVDARATGLFLTHVHPVDVLLNLCICATNNRGYSTWSCGRSRPTRSSRAWESNDSTAAAVVEIHRRAVVRARGRQTSLTLPTSTEAAVIMHRACVCRVGLSAADHSGKGQG